MRVGHTARGSFLLVSSGPKPGDTFPEAADVAELRPAGLGRRRAPAPGEGLEARLIATLGPLLRHLVAHARRREGWGELTYQQYNVLRTIDLEGPTGQADVARRLMVSPPVVTRLAPPLVEAGLVERRGDPKDKRAVVLALTPAGRRRSRAMRRDLLAAAGELLRPLPEEQRAAVAAALEELQVLFPSHHPVRP